ncbi:hypothetical protein BJY04DRAFT_198009 [Aspergillus karnatakaensis]|uniref:putative C6 transcription factor n=1 Tax=Aspergillus karnatakaensis TaxID=1810916 RepID=UPI003CCE22D7
MSQLTSDGRARKRTQQACEPCRRKKSKCSGERPTCSTCTRLGHRCFYKMERFYFSAMGGQTQHQARDTLSSPGQASDVNQDQWHDRLNQMESTLATLVNELKDRPLPTSTLRPPEVLPFSRTPGLPPISVMNPNIPRSAPSPALVARDSASPMNGPSPDSAAFPYPPVRSWAAAVEISKTYLLLCDSQPLPLFYPDTFVSTFPNRSFEIVYGVLAVALRFADETTAATGSLPNGKECKQAAYHLAMSSISTGHIELSTLQTLCLLAIMEFNDGNMTQCRVHGTLALTLARSAQLDREPRGIYTMEQQAIEERRRCYWSIVLLHHLIGEPITIRTPIVLHSSKLPFPTSAASPPSAALSLEGQTVASSETPTEEHGICSIVIQLSEVWCMAQAYVRSHGGAADGSGSCPPWHSSSKYSKTMELVMNLGDNLPPAHRYRFIHLSSVDSEDLQRSRDYWAPWLLSRFLYHTTLCVLNHPILIMLQIQGNRDVSEVFLQQTTFARIHHTSWLMHFIEFLDSRQFFVSDPIFGYCAAVLATIELHQSFTDAKPETAEKRKQNYKYCLWFVRKLSDRWPYMLQVANDLQQLMETTSALYQSNINNPNANKVSVDISGFFRILDISEFCSAGITTSPFGPSLLPSSAHLELPTQSHLERLPPITEIGNQSRSPPHLPPLNMEGTSEIGQEHNHEDQFASSTSQGFNRYPMAMENDDMLLQADQLFGSLYDLMTPWDTVPGTDIGAPFM